MNRVLATALSVPKACVRRLSATEVRCGQPNLTEIKKSQRHFQMDDDVPVYLKGGTKDYVLYITTLALLAGGLGGALHSSYKLITGKK